MFTYIGKRKRKRSLYLACTRLMEKRKRNKVDNTVHWHNTYRNAVGANPRDLLINTTLIGKSKMPHDWHSCVAAMLPFPVGYDRWTNYDDDDDDDELDACKLSIRNGFLANPFALSVSFFSFNALPEDSGEKEEGSLIKRFLFPNYR